MAMLPLLLVFTAALTGVLAATSSSSALPSGSADVPGATSCVVAPSSVPTAPAETVPPPATFGGEFITSNATVQLMYSTAYSSGPYKHAIFISNDGMHQFDLEVFVKANPNSTLAGLLKDGVEFTNARASNPSDSYPATAAIWTGATPRSSGIYWDDSYSRDLYPPRSNCQGPIGTETDYSEGIDVNNTLLNGGGGIDVSALPLRLTSWGQCNPVFPHDFIRVNSVFEVARQNGLYTAYADKHLSYEFVNGPSGLGLSEGYFPEVSSATATDDGQLAWDDLHWSAMNNWAKGLTVNGTANPTGAAPSLFGCNFQALTSAQSVSGYVPGTSNPTPNITRCLTQWDQRLGEFVATLKSQGIWNDTLLMIGSKQGQTPVDPNKLRLIGPEALVNATGVDVAFVTAADWGLLWLANSSDAYTAKANLLASNRTVTGVADVYAGVEVFQYGFGNPYLDPRAPDIIFTSPIGVLYRTDYSKEDHGGWSTEDADVPLIVVSGKKLAKAGQTYDAEVENRQIAATLLQALGLPLWQLDANRIDGTPVLPAVF